MGVDCGLELRCCALMGACADGPLASSGPVGAKLRRVLSRKWPSRGEIYRDGEHTNTLARLHKSIKSMHSQRINLTAHANVRGIKV